MRGIMADNDIQGQMKAIVLLLRSETWRDIWSSLNLTVRTFHELSLDVSVSGCGPLAHVSAVMSK